MLGGTITFQMVPEDVNPNNVIDPGIDELPDELKQLVQ
jgi:hypothetical protein